MPTTLYTYDGTGLDVASSSASQAAASAAAAQETAEEVQSDVILAMDWNRTVKAVAHRGYSSIAPENTIPAFRLARQRGFLYVETDISFTSDGYAVCLHDSTINRTSDGTGNIGSMTLATAKAYDFGSWKGSAYAGTRIPTFEEFISCCRSMGLHPYIELKQNGSYTEAQVQGLVDTVKAYGLQGKVSWISFSAVYLGYVKSYDPTARLGYVTSTVDSTVISTAQGLLSGSNEVFIDASVYTDSVCNLCRNAGLPLEVWTVDSESAITSMNPYVSGITSNSLIAGKVLLQAQ